MNPIEASVSRPYTVAVVVILALVFSALAVERIPVQLKPTIDSPQIAVSTTYRGASAVEVEEGVTRELEEVLQATEGLVKLTSDSSQGRSSITLEFAPGTDTRVAVVDVVNRLSRVARLPEEADEPAVDIASPDENQPVMWIALRSGYDADYVRRLVDEGVAARLERVPGVSSLMLVGGSPREVQVHVDPDALVAHGVSVQELAGALARGNLNVRGGSVETATRRLALRTIGRAERPADLLDLIVRATPRGSVRLRDVASVRDGYEDLSEFVNIDGQPGVAIGVRREGGANVVAMIDALDGVVEDLNLTFANRGLAVRLEPVYRETTYIRAALDFVTGNLVTGGVLVVVVLLVFLREVRSVLIIALSIPTSLAAVFLVLEATGRTLNVISLAGLAFASGMVVDNAVVVLENAFRHLELGKSPLRAAIDGGREMWGGVLASTLTTLGVLVPVLAGTDEATQLFSDLALTIGAAVGLSFLVSITVVPVLVSLLFRGAAGAGGGGSAAGADDQDLAQRGPASPRERAERATEGVVSAGLGPLGALYGRFSAALGRNGRRDAPAKLGFVLLVAAGALAAVKLAPKAEYLPVGNRNMIMFFASPVPGTRTEQVREQLRPLERWVLAQPEAQRMFAVSGARFNGGGVVLHEALATPQVLADFHRRMFGPAATLPGFRFVVPIRASLFRDPGKQFEVEVSGPDMDVLQSASGRLEARLREVAGVQFVRSSLVTGMPELEVRVDEERAKDLGLDVAELGAAIELVIAGRRVTSLVQGGREVDVNVVAPAARVTSQDELAALPLLTRGLGDHGGDLVALGTVAEVRRTTGPESIRRLERERNVLLTVNIAPEAPLERVLDDVDRDVLPAFAAALGPAYTLRTGGTADKLRSTLRALTQGFWLSVLIMYLLLVALFRSWIAPVVILVTVPLAVSGGLVGIRVAHELSGGACGFDVISMLGFVILGGLVVNNAILIVHQANNRVAEGVAPRRALAESTATRLRPILMTVVTTILGMLPLAIGGGAGAELYQGLGAVIVGGLTFSTLFTLFLVPVLLSLGHDARGLAPDAPRDEA